MDKDTKYQLLKEKVQAKMDKYRYRETTLPDKTMHCRFCKQVATQRIFYRLGSEHVEEDGYYCKFFLEGLEQIPGTMPSCVDEWLGICDAFQVNQSEVISYNRKKQLESTAASGSGCLLPLLVVVASMAMVSILVF